MSAMLEISESDDGRIGTLVTLGLDRAGETTGRVKVFTKDGTTMGDLPCSINEVGPPARGCSTARFSTHQESEPEA